MRSTRSTAKEMENKETDSLLTSLGKGVQYFAALFLLIGLSLLLLRIVKGEWPEIPDSGYSPSALRWFSVLFTVFPTAALFLGQYIKRGSVEAAGAATVMGCALLAFCVLNLAKTGHGWYGMGLAFFFVCDAFMALAYSAVKKARESSGDHSSQNP